MKCAKSFVIMLVFIILIGIVACAPKNVTSQPPAEPPTTTLTINAATQEKPSPSETQATLTAGIDVDELICEKLQDHHGIDRIYTATKTREEWNATLDRMNGYGANISEEEKQIIIDYLLSRQ